ARTDDRPEAGEHQRERADVPLYRLRHIVSNYGQRERAIPEYGINVPYRTFPRGWPALKRMSLL
ncbi:hypothetical protein, partial [Paraburkholderia silvatlantica]|uniref:hypothetical protein n=1 Tax=Paraburkholderia silvatlantica TaxID=321895 RepID=UPI003616289F